MSSEDERNALDSFGPQINTIEKLSGKYGSLMDNVRRRAPEYLKCSLGCGGRHCKYCNPEKWTDDNMAVTGLFSHWVTDEILATSRPIDEFMEKYNVIEQFKKFGIKSIINLQTAGEHSSCGPPLHTSGFSYNPQDFMDNEIFFYNFGWDDYGVHSLQFILDMTKVMAFAIKQGKVAVHCHAGMGRTGVLIAAYLIYSQRIDGDNAVHFVRQKRPGSVQTSSQVSICQQFAQYLVPLRMIFSVCDPRASPFTLEQFLNRQRLMLHGYEARHLKYIPKIIQLIWCRLLSLALNKEYEYTLKQDNSDIMQQMSPGAFQDNRITSKNNLSSEESLPSSSDSEFSLCGLELDNTTSSCQSLNSSPRNVSVSEHKTLKYPVVKKKTSILLSKDGNQEESECEITEGVARALAYDLNQARPRISTEQEAALMQMKQKIKSLQDNLNASSSSWNILITDRDATFLSSLMWSWLLHLQISILQHKDVQVLVNSQNPVSALKQLPKGTRHTLDFILTTLSKFPELSPRVEEAVHGRLAEVISFSMEDMKGFSYFRRKLKQCFMMIIVHKRAKCGTSLDDTKTAC